MLVGSYEEQVIQEQNSEFYKIIINQHKDFIKAKIKEKERKANFFDNDLPF